MANRQRAEARRKAQAKAARRGQSVEGTGGSAGVTINIWVIIVVVLALATGGIIWVAASGDDSSASDDTSNTSETSVEIPDSQPVTVTGEALPRYDSANPVDLAVGLPAPLLNGLDFQGDPITVDPSVSGPYMVVFLAHWCPHCNAEVPNYPPAEWFSNRGWSWPVLVDEALGDGEAGKAAVSYGASGWPYFVIVGADGLVKTRVSGEIEAAELQIIVDEALAS